jgi:hypothetical protein
LIGMSASPPKPEQSTKEENQEQRRERLAAALRDNLRKRKLQARARGAPRPEDGDPG